MAVSRGSRGGTAADHKLVGNAESKSLTLSQDKAAAAVGKPLSAGSVAGVHRRQERRGNHNATPAK